MVLPNLAFDALMFGLLLLAAAIDGAFPVTHGAVSLLIVGGATYWAAQELSDLLLRRIGWTQESLSTSVALCVGGFLYFWGRNSSDFSLLALSIGLMMGSLMVSISVLASIGGAFKEGRATPLLGWAATFVCALALGLTAGVLALVLGVASPALLPLKAGGIALALALWKLREKVAPPSVNPHFQEAAAQSVAPTAAPSGRVALFPQRGTLLDRLFPLLVTGVLLMTVARNQAHLAFPDSTSASATDAAAPGTAPREVAPSENGEAR